VATWDRSTSAEVRVCQTNRFLETLANSYQAPLERLDFYGNPESSRTYINDWVEEQTNDRIKNLLPAGSVQRDTALVLTNAVYFDGDWKYQFNKQATRDDLFTTVDGSQETVSMMFQEQAFRYAPLEDFQILEMPYAGDDLSMVVMLPNAVDGLADLEASLTSELLDASLEAMRQQKVQVHFPKFTFDGSFSLKSVLSDMGMEDAFTDAADFTGIVRRGSDGLRQGILARTIFSVRLQDRQLHNRKVILHRIIKIFFAHQRWDVEVVAVVADLQEQVTWLATAEGTLHW